MSTTFEQKLEKEVQHFGNGDQTKAELDAELEAASKRREAILHAKSAEAKAEVDRAKAIAAAHNHEHGANCSH